MTEHYSTQRAAVILVISGLLFLSACSSSARPAASNNGSATSTSGANQGTTNASSGTSSTTPVTNGSPVGTHTVTGKVMFTGVDSCVLDSANDVSIADQNKTVLAAAQMSPIQGTGPDCYETFTIHEVPDRPIFQFLESGIVVKTISQADLAAMNYDVGTIVST